MVPDLQMPHILCEVTESVSPSDSPILSSLPISDADNTPISPVQNSDTVVPSACVNHHPMTTRSKAGVFKPKVLVTDFLLLVNLPKFRKLKCPRNGVLNNTWTSVDAPLNTPIVSCR